MKILTFALHLRQMSILPKILMLCQRLGGEVTYVSAAEGRANIVVAAPKAASHRFAPQIRRLIDVLELTELHAVGLDAAREPAARRLRHTA
ncbi:MAG: hypothetical protein GXP29_15885 [Planctomycetes bacterium]|nr:hypothetical protein [Planctomycetota bacterium]